MKRMKRLSFQWRITLLTAILIARNLYLFKSSVVSFWYCQHGFAEWFCHEI